MNTTETIVALDFDNFNDAKSTVEKIGSAICYYKVGLELYVSCGVEIINFLKSKDKKIFLDLKFHDIPTTASKAVSKVVSYGVDMTNIHAQGGSEMMRACSEAALETCEKFGYKRPLLIAVTLLTSLDATHLQNFGIIDKNPEDYVIRLAKEAKKANMDGVVSSAKETALIKNMLGSDFITVTPGIRPENSDVKDQKRVVTPCEAKALGTDYIVVGRPITGAIDPYKAALNIIKELD